MESTFIFKTTEFLYRKNQSCTLIRYLNHKRSLNTSQMTNLSFVKTETRFSSEISTQRPVRKPDNFLQTSQQKCQFARSRFRSGHRAKDRRINRSIVSRLFVGSGSFSGRRHYIGNPCRHENIIT